MAIAEAGGRRAGRWDAWRWLWAGLVVLLAWDGLGLDLPLARLAASGGRFGWSEHWLLAGVLHTGGRDLSWIVGLWLLAGVWWPTGVLTRISRAGRLQWLASALLSLLLVSAIKLASSTSCPWDMSEFGGVARYASHWPWLPPDGGPGHCFPAGHASAGFAFLAGYFVLRDAWPGRARAVLAVALAAGLLLGIGQQLRGAHFMSHTLWTAWICWACAVAVDALARAGRRLGTGILAPHDT